MSWLSPQRFSAGRSWLGVHVIQDDEFDSPRLGTLCARPTSSSFSTTWSDKSQSDCTSGFYDNFDEREYATPKIPLIRIAEGEIARYRSQNPLNFALCIPVQVAYNNRPSKKKGKQARAGQVDNAEPMKLEFGQSVPGVTRVCRPKLVQNTLTDKALVHEKGRWMPMSAWLAKTFPASEAETSDETLQKFWDYNGKYFPMEELPDEIKLLILKHCVCQPQSESHGSNVRNKFSILLAAEVVYQLGDWKSLLKVSKKIRGLTLNCVFKHPMHIEFHGISKLENAFCRLSRAHTLMSDHPIPKTKIEKAQFRKYLECPTLYPQFDNFAAMVHGIQRLGLSFPAAEYIRFFKLSFPRIPAKKQKKITCDWVLDRFPSLNGIAVYLPATKYDVHFDDLLWHDYQPCKRLIHRWIYEAAIKELGHKRLWVMNFFDAQEKKRYDVLHQQHKDAIEVKAPSPTVDTFGIYTPYNLDMGAEVKLEHPYFHFMDEQTPRFESFEPADFPVKCACAWQCREIWMDKHHPFSQG